MKKAMSISGICLLGITLAGAPAPSQAKPALQERITKETLLANDTIINYKPDKPCHLDKYKYFCCPVRKIVRRKAADGKWTDYCYNDKEELIGLRKSDHRGTVKRSDFSAVSGCSKCRSTTLKQRSWKHDTNPRMAPPKKKKKR